MVVNEAVDNFAYVADVERLFHEITREQPAFRREIKPIDLVSPVFVKPSKSNSRILKQDGAFILSRLNDNDVEAAWKIKRFIYLWLTIPGDKKTDICRDLDYVGINKASLFRDLEKTGKYLRERI